MKLKTASLLLIILFFAAAGNVPTTAPTYPAANPFVYAVTAADSYGHPASDANTGEFVDLIAPGTRPIGPRSPLIPRR